MFRRAERFLLSIMTIAEIESLEEQLRKSPNDNNTQLKIGACNPPSTLLLQLHMFSVGLQCRFPQSSLPRPHPDPPARAELCAQSLCAILDMHWSRSNGCVCI